MGWARSVFVRALIFAAVPLGCAAQARELLVMPYRCAVINGEPRLSPSDDRGYSVVGRRDERDFSVCSPSDPSLCKRWKIYRFDVDCSGTRVPWIDVVAASHRGGRAWVDGRRLKIEMPARWGLSSEDACARSLDGEGPYGGGFRRFCADRRAFDEAPVVELPDGFAPMMGLDGIFVADNGRGAAPGRDYGSGPGSDFEPSPRHGNASGPIARTEDGGRLQWKASPVPPPRAAQSDEAASDRHEPANAPAKKSSATHSAASESATRNETSAKAEAKASHSVDAAPVAKSEPSKLDVRPTIINSKTASDPFSGSTAPAGNTATAAREAGDGTSKSKSPEGKAHAELPAPRAPALLDTATSGALKTAAALAAVASPALAELAPAPASDTHSAGDDSLVTASITKPMGGAAAAGALATPFDALGPGTLAAAVLLALTLAAFAYYQMKSQPGTDFANRDIGSLSLDDRGRDLVPTLDPAPARREPPGPANPTAGGPSIGNDIPATRAEAMQILGMGVASGVSEAAIKKIVDGLRMSWHPDAASSEEDRQLRELRIKQINAAWEIISGKRVG